MENALIPNLNISRTIYSDDVQNYTHYHRLYKSFPLIETIITIPIQMQYNPKHEPFSYGKEVAAVYDILHKQFKEYNRIEIGNESYTYNTKLNTFLWQGGGSLYSFEKGEILFYASFTDDMIWVKVLAKERTELYYDIITLIQNLSKSKKLNLKLPRSLCNIIIRQNSQFSLRSFHIPEVSFDMMHYNDDIKEVAKHIDYTLRNKNKGIVLLHGEMGTGKTSYLRTLMNMEIDKKIIYVPPDMASMLASPDIISFLESECNDSIIIIEDAENVLQTREAGGNQAVSNMLNTSDGILGDILKIQFVCTFNSSLEMIDPALRRPGRLIAEYEFKKLSVDKAKALIDKLYGIEYTENKELTLAEIYSYDVVLHKTKAKEKIFGFINNA